ncbi:MAG: amino acid adenylation domain-containing protein [Tildeniella torsiva UHER 1998/13D]|jgi:amino acid adenylation domain-containing protein/non-ribosomal peptide synthase protein (TIGR01720 family)|nr:amino acid adenylation domain-containing protein [Tildeniella torsiva UHER 1998/13D]
MTSTVHSPHTSDHAAANPLPEVPAASPTATDCFIFPVASAQQRLWFLDQLEPGNSAYNLPIAVRLWGALNSSALQQSFQSLIQRHEILRTTFTTVEQQPMQVVHPDRAFQLTILDLTAASDPNIQLQKIVRSASCQPFDLSQDQLLRGTLIRLQEREHVLLLVMHHIIADNWSMGVLVQELATLYPALVENRPAALPDLPIQYADFAVWQQEQLQAGQLQPQLDYWTQQLADLTPLQLPSDCARSSAPGRQGAKQTWTLSPQLAIALRQLSQATDVTLFMLLLAAFKALLYRYTGQSDVVVGSPIANRNQPEVQPLIGFFVNTLVLRSQLHPQLTVRELLSQIRQTTLAAYDHQDLPFEKLVEALQPDRSLHHTPLFQVWFALHNAPWAELTMGNVTLEPISLEPNQVQFDLSLEVIDTSHNLTVAIEYDQSLFENSTIARWFEHWQTLLWGMVTDPDRRLAELPLLSAAEQHQLLVEWNLPLTHDEPICCIHHCFEQQVERTPDAIALVFEDQQLTYQAVNQQANQLAHYLQTLGVEPETLVGLCLERSPALIIALLGILKAGAAYVPLDPSYPAERLAFVAQDSEIEILVTQSDLTAALLKTFPAGTVVALDRIQTQLTQHPQTNPQSAVRPDHLAYVIYTSGSTGQPKGVMVEHRALAHFTQAAVEEYGVTACDRVLQFASISFDAAAEEIFPALTQGATLVLRTEAMLHSFSEFLHRCQTAAVTVLDLPTAFWQQLSVELVADQAQLPEALRLVIIGGEAVLPQAVRAWQQLETGVRLVNSYGPTETTVVATVCDLTDVATDVTAPVPIGRPLPHGQCYVLDAEQNPVPIGIPGELYIGGAGLARGYLNRPELTTDRFMANPFGTGKLYRTGDRVRYRPDGILEFLGRVDDQVKLRGYRIELGEIEAVLAQHPAVQQAVVVLREDQPGQKRLVAFVVLNRPTQAEEFQEFLAQRLPDYMVPSAFVTLETLPLTPNGKLDRQALPVPETLAAHAAHRLPTTPAEKTLTQIWAQVLGLERVSVDDNFFSLGGDSILSIQVIAKANQAGLSLTPKQLFDHQTVAALAAVAGTTTVATAEQGAVTGAVPLTPIQQWFFEQAFEQPRHWNQAVLLDCRPALNPEILQQTVARLLEHHDGVRSRFVGTESGWYQEVLPTSSTAQVLEEIDLSHLPSTEQTAAIEAQSNRLQGSLDLEAGDLVRVTLFSLGANRSQRLLIVVHHLVIDGVSWRILLKDFQTVYKQLSRGQSVRLPAKTTSFQHWANQLKIYAQSPELHQKLDYWLEMLPTEIVPLPCDRPHQSPTTKTTVASSQTITLELSQADTQALIQTTAQVYQAQLYEILLTAFLLSLQSWTVQSTCLIDLEGHGREILFSDVDLSRTIGWFTTVYPAYFKLDSSRFEAALRGIQPQLKTVTQCGIDYGLLRYLAPQKISQTLQKLPQAEILFNYLGQFDAAQSQWTLASESSGMAYGAQNHRSYGLEVNSLIAQGCLQVTWTYCDRNYRQSTIAALAQAYLTELRSLISAPPQVLEPSSFPYFLWPGMSTTDLDTILATVEFEGSEA